MPVPPKQLIALLLAIVFSAACSDVPLVQTTPTTKAEHATATLDKASSETREVRTATRSERNARVASQRNREAVEGRAVREAAWVIAVAKGEAERSARVAKAKVRTGTRSGSKTPSVATTGSLAQVMQCIKDHESGDYTEHSHPDSGSGAFQYVPGTWRAWSERAGYGGYAYAYQAPPSVQDAVTVFTLTNGGAGNWSNKFGNDPCTGGI